MERYALMDYTPAMGKQNLGDFIQSLAAKQFLPHVDEYINREELSEYNGEPVKMIMNGWYMMRPENWPPSEVIDPLFVAMHINYSVENIMLADNSISYLKKHAPIGCRDVHTCEILRNAGVDAYFSGCLTLTLGQTYPRKKECSDEILFVNVLEELITWDEILSRPRSFVRLIKDGKFMNWLNKGGLMRKIFDAQLLKDAVYFNPMIPEGTSNYYEIADEYLKRLAAAKFVVTSKIHTALPCLGMGVPVIFVNGGLYDTNNKYRLGGLVDMMNQVIIGKDGSISTNFDIKLPITADAVFENPTKHLKYAKELVNRCRNFIADM